MARKDQKTVTVAVTEDQVKTIEARLDSWISSKTGRVTDDLEAYWAVLRIGMDRVRQVLTSDEAKLVLDVQNGAAALGGQPGIWIRGGLVLNVEDGIELNKYDEKWGIDGPELVRKLQRLGAGETAALLDWCRVMWERCEDEECWAKELGRFKEVV
jgi:hypothetical protein